MSWFELKETMNRKRFCFITVAIISNGGLVIQHEASTFQQTKNGAVEVSNL